MEALNSLKMKMYYGNDRATFYDQLSLEPGRKVFSRDMQLRLFNCAANGNREETEVLVEELFHGIRRCRVSGQDMEDILQAISRIIRDILEPEPSLDDVQRMDAWLSKVRGFDTLDEIQQVVMEALMEAAAEGAKHKSQRKSKLITDVLQYLEEYYMEDISLQKLAEQFFVNASYLSRLFKEEVGEIFTKHLMKLRIDHARLLLQTTHLKVYEISEAVGYSDVKYFNKIFKDLTGLTPADHRSLSNT